MKYLLDTHTFLWFCNGSGRLSENARTLIESPENISYLSMVSIWEMGIKVSLGKLRLQQPFETLIPQHIQQNGFVVLDVQIQHINKMIHLPFHHRDPFDRLLIAQAQIEAMPIISADETFRNYDVERHW